MDKLTGKPFDSNDFKRQTIESMTVLIYTDLAQNGHTYIKSPTANQPATALFTLRFHYFKTLRGPPFCFLITFGSSPRVNRMTFSKTTF